MWITLSVLLICVALCYCINRVHITIEHVHTQPEAPAALNPADTVKSMSAANDMQAFVNRLNSFMTGDADDGRL